MTLSNVGSLIPKTPSSFFQREGVFVSLVALHKGRFGRIDLEKKERLFSRVGRGLKLLQGFFSVLEHGVKHFCAVAERCAWEHLFKMGDLACAFRPSCVRISPMCVETSRRCSSCRLGQTVPHLPKREFSTCRVASGFTCAGTWAEAASSSWEWILCCVQGGRGGLVYGKSIRFLGGNLIYFSRFILD